MVPHTRWEESRKLKWVKEPNMFHDDQSIEIG